jgi:ABC-type transport system involved in multi-copper enzyme maturation permease subunit
MQSTYRETAESDQLKHSDTVQHEPSHQERQLTADDSLLLGMTGSDIDSTDTVTLERSRESRTLQTSPLDSLHGSLPSTGNSLLLEMVRGEMSSFAVPITLAFLFFGIFVSAGIIPSLMEKGTIDLTVSKPISRTALLLGRALGGLVAMASNLFFFVIAVWALYGWMSGIWYTPFITWTFLIPLFAFIVIYSGIILLNVLTESWILPMIIAYIHLMILSNLLSGRELILYKFIDSDILRTLIDGLYYGLPQTNDLLQIVPQAILTNNVYTPDPFIQGTLFIIVMLGLAAWRFERKDF